MIYIQAKESGDVIETLNSIKEAVEKIKDFYKEDEKEGIYEEDFYEIKEIKGGVVKIYDDRGVLINEY